MKKIILITSHLKNEWDGGDSIITDGLYQILPELKNHDIIYSKSISHSETEKTVSECDYVIHAGTPSWITINNRRFWKACVKHKKHIAMLGIGLALHYSSDIWYGGEDFVVLKDSGLIDLIICRDKFCYYWLKKLGYNHEKIYLMPCPGYYLMKNNNITINKKEIVFSLANPDETSHQTEETFKRYFNICREIIDNLKNKGNVYLLYQRDIDKHPEAAYVFNMYFPKEKIYSFKESLKFQEFILDKEVYIGVRNHGALTFGGAGKPSLLLGTDYRQFITDEIPYISRIDISFIGCLVESILAWYDSLSAESISKSLISYRDITFKKWRHITKNLI